MIRVGTFSSRGVLLRFGGHTSRSAQRWRHSVADFPIIENRVDVGEWIAQQVEMSQDPSGGADLNAALAYFYKHPAAHSDLVPSMLIALARTPLKETQALVLPRRHILAPLCSQFFRTYPWKAEAWLWNLWSYCKTMKHGKALFPPHPSRSVLCVGCA